MKQQLISILVCPEDNSKLALTISEENETEVLSGDLTCTECGTIYPINEGIPNLLPRSIRDL